MTDDINKVKREYFGTVHHHAWCEECDWLPDTRPRNMSRAAKRHTARTGHSTSVENGASWRFTLGGEKDENKAEQGGTAGDKQQEEIHRKR